MGLLSLNSVSGRRADPSRVVRPTRSCCFNAPRPKCQYLGFRKLCGCRLHCVARKDWISD